MMANAPRVFTFTEAGGHPVNEDAFGLRPHPVDEGALLFAIADGMGGQSGGGRAAKVAVWAALDEAARTAKAGPFGIDWCAVLRRADQAVLADDTAGFTTLACFTVHNRYLSGGSCGDSAGLVLRGWGPPIEVTAGQRKSPPVGTGEAMFLTFLEEDLVAPWLLLAMTDGVWKYVGWERIKGLSSRLRGQELIDSLQKAARLPGSGKFQDDFTLVVIQDGE